jgi:DNA-directed RNA polymerase subunit M/transcription elongation factor TFIIS
MVLEFCPVCKGLLQLKEENGRIIGWCTCGFKRMQGIELSSVDKNDMDNMKSGEGIVSDKNIGESINKICKKCGYDKAEVAELQSRESAIFIYTCLKCKSVEREVQGSSKF